MSRSSSFAFAFAWIASVVSSCSVLFPSNNIEPPPPSTSCDVHAVRVDSVGYLPNREKVATVVLPAGTTTIANTNADVRSAADDSVVWTCTITGPMTDQASSERLLRRRLHGVQQHRGFLRRGPGAGHGPAARSATFHVGSDVFRDALTRSMLGLYGQRCGRSVSITLDGHTWSHGACHKNDAYLDYLTGESDKRPSVGGWHDAGDYGKYITNGAFSAGMLLAAWEHFQPTLEPLQLARSRSTAAPSRTSSPRSNGSSTGCSRPRIRTAAWRTR